MSSLYDSGKGYVFFLVLGLHCYKFSFFFLFNLLMPKNWLQEQEVKCIGKEVS